MVNKPIMIRLSKELKDKAEKQASILGLNTSEYLRLLISLDEENMITKSYNVSK
jgi:antitoxin component of RelBE/YafQ-DinJ toxin-antitoxin module